jgi:hypothetical protein
MTAGSNWTTLSIHPQETCSSVGMSWTAHNMLVSGFGLGNYESKDFFVRQATIDLWDQLNSLVVAKLPVAGRDYRALWIQGCPGVGKSSVLFGWVNYKATNGSKVLWVHESGKRFYVTRYDGMGYAMCSNLNMRDPTFWSEFQSIVSCVKYDIIVLDGVKEFMKELYLNSFRDYTDSLLVGCTSYQSCSYNSEDGLFNYKKCVVNSWTLDEYYQGWRARVIPADNEEDILLRYFYAGGSCRYFVVPDLAQLTSFLRDKIGTVTNYSDLLGGHQGDMSQVSVNSLMQRFGDSTGIVSEYVVRILSKKVDFSFINLGRAVMPSNSVWQGWIFELEFLVRCRVRLSI